MAGGRPTKFTPRVRETILQAVSVGAPLALAAESAGISYDVLRLWLRRGERQKAGDFRQFYLDLKAAEGRLGVKLLAVIEKSALDGNWNAAAWKLERRFPKHFGRPAGDRAGSSSKPDTSKALNLRWGEHLANPAVRAAIQELTVQLAAVNAFDRLDDRGPDDDARALATAVQLKSFLKEMKSQ